MNGDSTNTPRKNGFAEKIVLLIIGAILGAAGGYYASSVHYTDKIYQRLAELESTNKGETKPSIDSLNSLTTTLEKKLGNIEEYVKIREVGNVTIDPLREVEHNQLITGRCSGIPGNSDIWLYVYAPGELKYYYASIERETEHPWRAGAMFGRLGEDIGTTYKIGVTITARDSSQEIRELASKGTGSHDLKGVKLTEIAVKRR